MLDRRQFPAPEGALSSLLRLDDDPTDGQLILAWLLTLPATILIAGALFWLLSIA